MPAFRAFPRLRRTRNNFEYPDIDTPGSSSEDSAAAADDAEAIVTAAASILAAGRLDAF